MKIGTHIKDKDGNTYRITDIRDACYDKAGTTPSNRAGKDYFIKQIDDAALQKFDSIGRNARLNGRWVQDHRVKRCKVVA